ncbi:MAG: helix-turn-helix transcriptional regulator [Chloroflexota bacterium]
MKLAALARHLGKHPSVLSNWFGDGYKDRPTREEIERLSAYLDLDAIQAGRVLDCFEFPRADVLTLPPDYWGPAGRAPQDVDFAMSNLRVQRLDCHGWVNAIEYLTDLWAFDGIVIGWVIGTAGTYRLRLPLRARLPAGACIDYDPQTATVNGRLAWRHEFRADWARASLASDARFEGHKITVYWTPCRRDR